MQVLKACDLSRLSAELLIESVTQIVSWVCGNQKNTLPVFAHLDCQTTGSGGLTDSTLAADKNPFK